MNRGGTHVGVLSAIDAGDRPSAIESRRAAARRVCRGAAGTRLLPARWSVVHYVRRASRPVVGCGEGRPRRAGRGSGGGVPGAFVTVSVPRAPRRSPWCRAGAHRGLRALPTCSGNRSAARAACRTTDVGYWVLRVDAAHTGAFARHGCSCSRGLACSRDRAAADRACTTFGTPSPSGRSKARPSSAIASPNTCSRCRRTSVTAASPTPTGISRRRRR